jgi:hypothetical protein
LIVPRRVLRSVVLPRAKRRDLTGSGLALASRIAFWISTPPKTDCPVARNACSGKLGYSWWKTCHVALAEVLDRPAAPVELLVA